MPKRRNAHRLTPEQRAHIRAIRDLSRPMRRGMEECASMWRPPCATCPLVMYCPRPE